VLDSSIKEERTGCGITESGYRGVREGETGKGRRLEGKLVGGGFISFTKGGQKIRA